jgi:hypothetical protein
MFKIDTFGYRRITFESSASEGAILVMPQGAYAEDLANVSRFRQYLTANAESWYRYINTRGRGTRNGDIVLVIGCDKAYSWGMATFVEPMAQNVQMSFKLAGERPTSTCGWDYSGIVEAKAGPDPEETEELMSGDGDPGVYMNQCLFVRALPVKLRDDIWQSMDL